MSRKSKAALRRRAEALRATIKQRTLVFCLTGLAAMPIARAFWSTADMPVAVYVILAASLVTFFWQRRRWMREFREALAAAGVDPERDELVENTAGARNTLMILFGVFGGMFAFLTLFIWLARR